jgi:hypothetical protein
MCALCCAADWQGWAAATGAWGLTSSGLCVGQPEGAGVNSHSIWSCLFVTYAEAALHMVSSSKGSGSHLTAVGRAWQDMQVQLCPYSSWYVDMLAASGCMLCLRSLLW